MKSFSRVRVLCGWLALSAAIACGGSKPEPQTSPTPSSSAALGVAKAGVPEPTRVLPTLRTGTLEPVEMAPLRGELVGYLNQGGIETFKISLKGQQLQGTDDPWLVFDGVPAAGPVSVPALAQFLPAQNEVSNLLWLRRTAKDATPAAVGELSATLLTRPYYGGLAQQYPVTFAVPAKLKSDPALQNQYLAALKVHLGSSPLASLLSKVSTDNDAGNSSYADWSSLMRLMSGYDSVEGALLSNETLRLSADPKKATVPLETLAPPAVESHPWQQMLSALANKRSVPEPLASATPNDFYFVRAGSYDALQLLLDEADTWISPGVRLARGGGRRHDLVDRYRKQLGLSHSELTRWLGPKLVKDLALVGSDPFVRQGSDVTLLVRPFDQQAFANSLNTKLAVDHPGAVTQTSATHAGVTITSNATADGVLRQYVAHLPSAGNLGALSVISNSPAAIRRVVDSALGKSGALSAELDFQYILARDAEIPGDIFCYLSDRFVQTVVGPKQRVLDARRQLARAELSRVGYGALLFGWLNGREPKTKAELLANPWLPKDVLKHSNGEAIRFELGQAPVSSFGTPAFLTPIIDLPVPTRVTPEEQSAYLSFAQSYAWSWSEHVDPIGARFQIRRDAGKVRLESHVRVLPVINTNQYREVWSMAGDSHLSTHPNFPGLHFSLGIGQDSELRRTLSGQSRSFLGKDIKFDWLGDWVTVGVGDEPSLGQALKDLGEAPELPPADDEARMDHGDVLAKLPLYLALDIKKAGAAAVVLTMLRQLAQQAVPDMLEWGEHEKHRDVTVVRVKLEEIEIFYALTKQRLFVSSMLGLVHDLIDGELDGRGFATSNDPKSAQGGQLVVDLLRREPSGLVQALGWVIEKELREQQRADERVAEVVLRGAPSVSDQERARLAMSYIGYVPVSPEGAEFSLDRFGVKDPLRGTAYRPVFSEVPLAGSPLAALLKAFGRGHAEVAFDKEPGGTDQHSLRTFITLERPE